MNTSQIVRVLNKHNSFLGVFPCDKLPTSIKSFPAGLVANTDPFDKPGKHWVAIYVDRNGVADFFDSYGFKPTLKPFLKFLNKFHWRYSTKRIQGPLSSVCGHYCIYFLTKRFAGESTQEILNHFTSVDTNGNDIAISDWVDSSFDIETEPFDLHYIVFQLCRALVET